MNTAAEQDGFDRAGLPLDGRWNWPEDYSHENGNYMNKCKCGRTFHGHKRRPQCKVCAGLRTQQEQPTDIRRQGGNHPAFQSWVRDQQKNAFDMVFQKPTAQDSVSISNEIADELWVRLMSALQKRGMSPSNSPELFKFVSEVRATHPQPTAQPENDVISVTEVKEILRDAVWGSSNRPDQKHLSAFIDKYNGL